MIGVRFEHLLIRLPPRGERGKTILNISYIDIGKEYDGLLLIIFLGVLGVSYYLGKVQLKIKKSDEERNVRMNTMVIQVTEHKANLATCSTSRRFSTSIETKNGIVTANNEQLSAMDNRRIPLCGKEQNSGNWYPKIIDKNNKVSPSPICSETKEEVLMNVRRINNTHDEFFRMAKPRTTLLASPETPQEVQCIPVQQQLQVIRYVFL